MKEEGQEERGSSGGSGMGISVSVISPPILDEAGDSSRLHGYAMRDDVAAISAFLSANEGADIDVRDEYVSLYPAFHCARLGALMLLVASPSSSFTHN